MEFVARSFTDFIYNLRLIDPEHKDQFDFLGEHGTYTDLLNFLAQKNINSKNAYDRTVAQECARHGNLELLKQCHFHGADFSGTMNFAFLNEKPEVIKYLIELGMDINERDSSGKTPLDNAISYSRDFIREMRQLGARTSSEL
jgi:ankyrin repeat protein